eukprot:6239256-Ditylum_brightwellii.AAC.1
MTNCGVLLDSLQFQQRSTKLWRGDVPAGCVLIPPVSPEDEPTNKGVAKVLVSILILCDILRATSQNDTDGKVWLKKELADAIDFPQTLSDISSICVALKQAFQVLLWWKHIRESDVTKCYQQAAGLVTLLSDEFKRQLIAFSPVK